MPATHPNQPVHTDGLLETVVAEVLAPAPDGSSPPPGALAALSVGGAVRHASGGFAQRVPGREPVRFDWSTRTDAGSVTKVLGTTAALMALVGAGEVDLDAPAGRYLPLPGLDVSTRELLEHRAGRWEWWPLYLSGVHGPDAVAHAAALPPRYPARTARHYSDLGFILLGALVDRVAGDLAAAVAELVCRPFGLTETRYAAPAPGAPVAASSTGDAIEYRMVASGEPYPVTGSVTDFTGWREHVLIGEVNDGNSFHAFDGVAGHAGLFTTAADLLRFGDGLLRSLAGDGPLSRDVVRTFLTVGADPGQALGFRRWDNGVPGGAFGHTGFPGVAFAVLPQQDATVVLLTNRLHAPGPPRPTEPMWLRTLAAAQQLVH